MQNESDQHLRPKVPNACLFIRPNNLPLFTRLYNQFLSHIFLNFLLFLFLQIGVIISLSSSVMSIEFSFSSMGPLFSDKKSLTKPYQPGSSSGASPLPDLIRSSSTFLHFCSKWTNFYSKISSKITLIASNISLFDDFFSASLSKEYPKQFSSSASTLANSCVSVASISSRPSFFFGRHFIIDVQSLKGSKA